MTKRQAYINTTVFWACVFCSPVDPDYQLGFWHFVVALLFHPVTLIGAAIRKLFPEPDAPDAIIDDNPPSLSKKGDEVPMIYGTTSTSGMMASVWGRQHRLERPNGKESETLAYFENAFHPICMGGTALHAIFKNNKLIWPTTNPANEKQFHGSFRKFFLFSDKPADVADPEYVAGESGAIRRGVTPNGTSFSFGYPNTGSFQIYWAEPPSASITPNPLLSKQLGIFSQYPYLMYVVWNQSRLGPTSTWWNPRYVVTGNPIEVVNNPDFTLVVSPQEIRTSSFIGMNPVNYLYFLLRAFPPLGLGYECELILNAISRLQ